MRQTVAEPIVLRGERVVLRGYRPEEVDEALARLEEAVQAYGMPVEDDEVRRSRRRRFERSGTRTEWEIMFAITAGDRVVGDVQARCSDQAMPPGVWEIGVAIHDEADRNQGLGGESVALLTSHLFERQDAHRVQATTDVDNAPMRHVLEALGFQDEGTLRGFMPVADGAPRDYEIYAMTKTTWMETP